MYVCNRGLHIRLEQIIYVFQCVLGGDALTVHEYPHTVDSIVLDHFCRVSSYHIIHEFLDHRRLVDVVLDTQFTKMCVQLCDIIGFGLQRHSFDELIDVFQHGIAQYRDIEVAHIGLMQLQIIDHAPNVGMIHVLDGIESIVANRNAPRLIFVRICTWIAPFGRNC